MGRLGYGILQALSENLQIKKKKHCFGFDLAGWGWGGGREVAGGAESADSGGRWRYCSVGCCLAFEKKRNRLYLDDVDAAAASCLLSQEKYQFPVWIWYNGGFQFKNCCKCPKI